jgi:hypothetical protein
VANLLDRDHVTDMNEGTLFLTSGLFAPKPTDTDQVRAQAARAVAAADHRP